MAKNIFKYIFSIDKTSTNRVIIYILGFRIRFLKKEVSNSKEQYIKLDCPVTEIPKATGGLRQIQLAELKLLTIFDEVCKKYNYEYWIDFGNLLGAARHKGFIPWDDDVDLGMIRDDYEKFIEQFKGGIKEYPDLYLKFDNNGKNRCFVKILHKNIPNIQIDIFPYDFYYKTTNNEEKINLTRLLKSCTEKWYYNAMFLFFRTQPNLMRKRFRKILKTIILKNNLADKSTKPSLFYGIDYPHKHIYHVFDYETIYPLKRIMYEDIEVSAPNNIHELLTQVFGDYMQLPNDCYPRHASGDNIPLEIIDEMNNFINS